MLHLAVRGRPSIHPYGELELASNGARLTRQRHDVGASNIICTGTTRGHTSLTSSQICLRPNDLSLVSRWQSAEQDSCSRKNTRELVCTLTNEATRQSRLDCPGLVASDNHLLQHTTTAPCEPSANRKAHVAIKRIISVSKERQSI